MPRVCFLGAGSTIFAKNVLGDCMLTPGVGPLEIVLHDIDPVRLEDSRCMLETISRNLGVKVSLQASLDRREALRGAQYVVNAVQIGGYEPCTVTDFEVPKRFGLRQTIADTLGIGGIFRALRTIPVLEEFAQDIVDNCPDAWLLNYSNPMAMLTGYLQTYTPVKTVGLCHSVQHCVDHLLRDVGMEEKADGARWEIAGINHQAWVLRCEDKQGCDLYPEIKRRAFEILETRKEQSGKPDLVRYEIMRRFGYYVTESSEHNAEYMPYFIKSKYPDLVERYKIPLDEYPRRCIKQRAEWETMRKGLVGNAALTHERTQEYASGIIAAMETDKPMRVHGNVLNANLIENLPGEACVEVPCMVDRSGVHPCRVGVLPEQCAALNRTNINVQLLTLQAACSKRKEDVYRAALLDPHTSAELSIDDIVAMCDALFEAHGAWMPEYK